MNPSTPLDYDITGHNDSARWKNAMGNFGLPWTDEEIAIAHHWWSKKRPVDKNRRAILDSFQAPNGYAPLLGFAGGNEYLRVHAAIAQKRTATLVFEMINDAGKLSERFSELKVILEKRRCEIPGLLPILAQEKQIHFEKMLEIVLTSVFEYIQRLEDETHKAQCKEYVILFFRIYGDGPTAHFAQISALLKD